MRSGTHRCRWGLLSALSRSLRDWSDVWLRQVVQSIFGNLALSAPDTSTPVNAPFDLEPGGLVYRHWSIQVLGFENVWWRMLSYIGRDCGQSRIRNCFAECFHQRSEPLNQASSRDVLPLTNDVTKSSLCLLQACMVRSGVKKGGMTTGPIPPKTTSRAKRHKNRSRAKQPDPITERLQIWRGT